MIQHDLSYHTAFLACLFENGFDIVDPSCLNQIQIVPWVKQIQRLVKIPLSWEALMEKQKAEKVSWLPKSGRWNIQVTNLIGARWKIVVLCGVNM